VKPNARLVPCAAFFALAAHVGCGDVTSDLITGDSGGSTLGGASMGGSATGGASMGGSATGGSSGSSTGGSDTGGSSSGGVSTGGSGSGGTPICTTNDDCTSGSERNICRVSDGVCVECTDEGPCDPDENCSAHMGECARPCASDADCIDEDDAHCYIDIGFCTECFDDTHCSTGEVCANYQCNDP
jgi:hypothetical protein